MENAMTLSLADLAARVERLEHVEAIRALKARYLRACDLKMADQVRDCFLPGQVRIAYQGFPEFTDRDSFVAIYQQMACQPGVFDLHHASNAEIALTGPDSARGLWSLNFRTILLAQQTVTQLVVEYDDVYRLRDGRWWIEQTATRVLSCLVEQIDADGASRYLSWGEPPSAG